MSGGTTFRDSKLRERDDEGWRDYYARITESGHTAIREVRRASSYLAASGTVTVEPAFSAQIASGADYQFHRYDPRLKFLALDLARFDVSNILFKIVRDDTITADGLTNEWDIPTSVRNGPFAVVIEERQAVDVHWNVLTNPMGDTTSNWTAANGISASVYNLTEADRIIPKYGNAATKLVYTDGGSDGTYSQVVADMDIDADDAAGREMFTAWWVYGEATTSGAVVEIVTDAGTLATSSSHTGTGWELLTATGVVAADNSTTLTCRLRIPTTGSNNQVVYAEHRWLAYGSELPNMFREDQPVEVYRDDTLQRFRIPFNPPRGHQVRLIGRDLLSALGDDVDTQASNTMEVDNQSAELLYAAAADRLFGSEMLNAPVPASIAQRAAIARGRVPRLRESQHEPASKGGIMGPYW